jgi:serine/threonine-protein kinase
VVTWRGANQDRPTQLPRNSAVDLVVSSGPSPRTVPRLAGATEAEARDELTKLGLVARVGQEFSSTVRAGLVLRTDPPEGKQVRRGDPVTVVMSKGADLVTVPDVSRARTLEEAITLLEGAGLKAGGVSGPARGRPFATDPAAGGKVERGTKVDIYLRP